MSEEAFKFWQACLASTASMGAAWLKFSSSGVVYDDKEIRGESHRFDDVVGASVRDSIQRNVNHRRAHSMMETYGITRHPDFENVLEVNFAHFRTVRDVRGKLYGDWRSPLASDQRVRP